MVLEKFNNPIDQIMKVIKNDSFEKNATLFEANSDNVDLKSDFLYPEDVFISTLIYNDEFLKSRGLKPIYHKYLIEFMRKRFSLDRGSRNEFVNVNKKDFMDDNLSKLGSISNLTEVRK